METSGRRGGGPFSHEWTKNWTGKAATGKKIKIKQKTKLSSHRRLGRNTFAWAFIPFLPLPAGGTSASSPSLLSPSRFRGD